MERLKYPLLLALALFAASVPAWDYDPTYIDGMEIRMPDGIDGSCEFFADGRWRDEYDPIVQAARSAHRAGQDAQAAAREAAHQAWKEAHPIEAEYGHDPYNRINYGDP